MEIISRTYHGIEVLFDNSDSLYINATQIAKQFKKDVREWKRSKQTNEYIDALSGVGFSHTTLIKVVSGNFSDGREQGTWIHKKLIIAFARWLSPEFAVWCDSVIEEILKTGSHSLGRSNSEQSEESNKEKIELELLGLKTAIEILKVNEASKILMTTTLYDELGLKTSYLPKYSNEQHTYSLSALLKKFKIGISAKKLNLLLISAGILEVKTRKSTKEFENEDGEREKIRTFKSLTEKGLEFGKNLISPHNQLETQPHYFENRFQALIESLKL
jgi:hypothetical protein